MSVTAIVGANWGDEGKGKITDFLAAKSDIVVRFQGGNNAGHTIINDYGKFSLHLLPSGVCYPNIVNILGPGVAVNITSFLEEKEEVMKGGVPEPNIKISNRAQVIMPYHILFDKYEEERLKDKKFGSTKKGIAPFYSDKYLKIGIQICELFDEKRLKERLRPSIEQKNVLLKSLYKKDPIDLDKLVEKLIEDGEKIKPYVCDTTTLLHEALSQDKNILVEGQLGALRDPDHGIYPFSTSSSTLAGFAPIGAGLPLCSIKKVIAVAKSYSTCVGAGPFVSEIFGNEAEELREKGGEYGATTGRPRRIGWFDAVATRYGCKVQGATEVVLSLLDVLGYLEKIPVCVAYEIEDKKITNFPVTGMLYKSKPIIKEFDGWNTDISNIRNFSDLPLNAQNYVKEIEKMIEVPVSWVSVGPNRDEMIRL